MIKINLCKEFGTNGGRTHEERYSCENIEQRISFYRVLTELGMGWNEDA